MGCGWFWSIRPPERIGFLGFLTARKQFFHVFSRFWMAHGSTGHQMPPGHEARNPGFGGQLWAAAWPKTFWLFVGELVPAFRSFSFRVSSGGLKFEFAFFYFFHPKTQQASFTVPEVLQVPQVFRFRWCHCAWAAWFGPTLGWLETGWVPVTPQCLGDWLVRQQIWVTSPTWHLCLMFQKVQAIPKKHQK